MSGVKATRTVPVTACAAGSTAMCNVYRGRFGSGAGYAGAVHGDGTGRSAVCGADEPNPQPGASPARASSSDACVRRRNTTIKSARTGSLSRTRRSAAGLHRRVLAVPPFVPGTVVQHRPWAAGELDRIRDGGGRDGAVAVGDGLS